MMRLYDTARRQVVPFEPGEVVTLYTCGITPYDAAHLGHAATYLAFDVLQRRLRDMGHETRCVRNVTDVDDDILRKARELGVHYLDLAGEELARFDSSMSALGLLPAASEPRATSAIAEILSLVDAVLEGGHAYRSGGAVYFDVSSFGSFGQLSHLGRDEMLVLARERGGNPDDPNKDDPLDFVLWQPSAPDEPSWESRWGPGRPGWHVECSALRSARDRARRSTSTAGGAISCFPTTNARRPSPRRSPGSRLRASLDARRDGRPRRREDVEVARQPRLRGGPARSAPTPPLPASRCSPTTTAKTGSGTTGRSTTAADRLESWKGAEGDAGSAAIAGSAALAGRSRSTPPW